MDNQRDHQSSFFSIIPNENDQDFFDYSSKQDKEQISNKEKELKINNCQFTKKRVSQHPGNQNSKGFLFQTDEISMIKQVTNDYDNFFLEDDPSVQDSTKYEHLPVFFSSKSIEQKQTNFQADFTLPPLSLQCIFKMQDKPAISTTCYLNNTNLKVDKCGQWKLECIFKVKLCYENYKKVLVISIKLANYQDHQRKTKIKIHIQNDLQDQMYGLFSSLVLRRLLIMGAHIYSFPEDENSDKILMEGEILKKSKHLSNWAMRKMVLTDRIESFKNGKCTFEIKDIKQIWTRFQFIKDSLILKIRHGIDKTQLGIPSVNFWLKYSPGNWLYRIYRLVKINSI